MNIFSIIKGIVIAATLAIMSLTGLSHPDPVLISQFDALASSTNAVIQDTLDQATTTTKADVQEAYNIGKSVGKLQEKIDQMKAPIINQSTTTPMNENTTTGSPTQPAPSTTGPAPETVAPTASAPTPAPTVASSNFARIELVSPIPGKGLHRHYVASPEIKDESNYIELGAVLYDANGQAIATAGMSITATDQTQNKLEQGTGDVMTVYVNGDRRQVPVYSFHYEFKTPGVHTVTFVANGMEVSVDLDVASE